MKPTIVPARHRSSQILGLGLLTALLLGPISIQPATGQQVVAYWGFLEEYEFDALDRRLTFSADVDATNARNARLQAFLGDPENLDHNGGTGFEFRSSISGISYPPSRTIKWDDVRGGGATFDIGGTTEFRIDKHDGTGPQTSTFSNDGLLYITLDGTGFQDFRLRFDIEGTPDALPATFDIFYRLDGSGVWHRQPTQNNIPLTFVDYDPIDPDNQLANSGLLRLPNELANQRAIELIIGDFAENGNDEMEIDNVEISATPVPEPGVFAMAFAVGLSCLMLRRRAVS